MTVGDHSGSLRQQTALARFGELALKADDLDEILTEACRLIGEALGTDLAKVMELQPDGKTLLARAGVGWKSGVVGTARVKVSDDTSEAHALKTGKPMTSPDIAVEKRFNYPPFLIDNGVRAVANVVIIGPDSKPPFGILQIDSRKPRSFNDDDTTFLSSYANLIAAAVTRLNAVRELRDREAQLRNSIERQQAALETGLLGFFEWDVAAGLITADKHFAGFYGLDPAAVLAGIPLTCLSERIHPDDQAAFGASVDTALHSCADYVKEVRIVQAEGAVRWVHIRGHCIEHEGSRPLRYTGIVVEVTASKTAETALRHANEALEAKVAERTHALVEANDKLRAEAAEREQVEEALRQSHKMEAVGQLTGGIAHDFNNMLQAIGSSLELMSHRVAQGRPADAAKLVANASATVERAAALTNRLLAFARRQALQPRPVDPDSLVRSLLDLIQRAAGPAVDVRIRVRNGIWTVLCDQNQLENVLLNLAINARDAMPSGGTLTLATADVRLTPANVASHAGVAPGDYVEISVTDTGLGMDETTRSRAFEPFFTTKPIGQGTGLGLSQVYGFVRQSGGTVQLDSAPGAGTTVRLYLPRHIPTEDALAGAQTPSEPAPPEPGAVVLLVDDEEQIRLSAAETLRDSGFHVLEAPDGPAALEILHATPPVAIDLLVTDVGLPGGVNGRQVADAARVTRAGLPVLLITGFAGPALERHLAPGMVVLGKPFTLADFMTRVRSLTQRPPTPPTQRDRL